MPLLPSSSTPIPSTSSSTPWTSVDGASSSDIQLVTSVMKSAVASCETSTGTLRCPAAVSSSCGGASPRQTTTHAGSLASNVAMPTRRAGSLPSRYSISVPPSTSTRCGCSCSGQPVSASPGFWIRGTVTIRDNPVWPATAVTSSS